MGIKASNTAEVYFEDVKVPVENVLGGMCVCVCFFEGKKQFYISSNFISVMMYWRMNGIGVDISLPTKTECDYLYG